MAATPAIRAAEEAGIRFTLHEYEHDPSSTSYGDEAAAKLDVDPARLFKTLVVSVDGDLRIYVVPADRQLDLRSVGKRAQMADRTQAERATGYVAGGISPLGQRRRLPTFVDPSALEWDTVLVSAGRRGLQIELRPQDLVALTAATVG